MAVYRAFKIVISCFKNRNGWKKWQGYTHKKIVQ